MTRETSPANSLIALGHMITKQLCCLCITLTQENSATRTTRTRSRRVRGLEEGQVSDVEGAAAPPGTYPRRKPEANALAYGPIGGWR
jgi:hypothetical protein